MPLSAYQWYEQLGIHLTVAPFSLLGIGDYDFLGCNSYSRRGKRNLRGRCLSPNARWCVSCAISCRKHDAHRRIVSYLVALSWSLKQSVAQTDPTADLRRLLPEERVNGVSASSMPTNRILLLAGNEIGHRRRASSATSPVGLMDNKLGRAAYVPRLWCAGHHPGAFRLYFLILQRTVYLFCTLLPFALVGDLHYMTPFVSVFISYTFLSWDSLAEELEDPSGTAANDLPLNARCAQLIERTC